MRAKADDDAEKGAEKGSGTGAGGGRRSKIDLSLPQVAGSAVAAVVAAKLASSFGVYGTILGAGVVSVIATCGGTVFQHFLKRTGEQLRDVRDVTAQTAPGRRPAPAPGEFGEATLHRARVRGRRRPVVAAAVVFGVTMAGITSYELVSGSGLGGGSGTTVAGALSGHNRPSHADDSGSSGSSGSSGTDSFDSTGPSGSPGTSDSAEGGGQPSAEPSTTSSGTPADGATEGSGESAGSVAGEEATPDAGESAGDGGQPDATATPSPSATGPAPSASSRSGTADPDRAGPEER